MKKNLAAENNQDTKGFDDSQITMFLANWEMLEELVNEVYVKGQVEPTDRDLFGSLKLALRRYYRYLSEELHPFWRQVKVAGKFLKNDPVAELLDTPRLSAFITNWEVIQMVPAAREALNMMLVAGR